MGCEGVSGTARGTFPLDCFYLGIEAGLSIEMVMALCLSVVGARVLIQTLISEGTMVSEDELAAAKLIGKIIGSEFEVNTLGDGDVPDFEIMIGTDKIGFGEAKNDVDKDSANQWATLLGWEVPQLINLPKGSGSWSIRIKNTANLKKLTAQISDLITQANLDGVPSWDSQYEYPAWKNSELLHRMQILGMMKIPSPNDVCYIQPDGIGGAIPPDSNSTIGWISELFKRSDWSNSWNRMRGLKCREKHVFFWIGSNSPQELRLRVSFHPEEPPLLNPELPEWVTHLWIGAHQVFGKHQYVWKFEPQLGWKSYVVED